MKNLSKTMFGALALVGVSTSVAIAGDMANHKDNEVEANVIKSEVVVDNGVVTGATNYYINSNGTAFIYDTDDGIDYNVSEGNLKEILSQIENGTYDMSKPFAIFESDHTKDLYLLVWDGSELLQRRNSDLVGQPVIEIIQNEDGSTTEKEGIYGLDDNGELIVIHNS